MNKKVGKVLVTFSIIMIAFLLTFTNFPKAKKNITDKLSDNEQSEEVFEKTDTIHASESSDELPININLQFTGDEGENLQITDSGKKAVYNIEGIEQTVSMLLTISYSSDGYDGEQTIKAGRLRIEIPRKAFKGREDEKFFMVSSSKFLESIEANGMLEYLESESTSDNFVFTNKDLSAAQISVSLNYNVTAFSVEDKLAQDYNVVIIDTQTGNEIFKEPINATFNTHVRDAKLTKKVDDFDAANGSYYAWDDTLTTRYAVEENDLDFDNYGYVSYEVAVAADLNQKSTVYISDSPSNNGEVIAVSKRTSTYRTPFSLLEKVTEGKYKGTWKYEMVNTRYSGASEYYYVLVRYPKSELENDDGTNASLTNKATVTFAGVDGYEEDVTTAEGECSSIWQSAFAGSLGDIWSVDKKTKTEDIAGAINLLKNGKDVSFTYTIGGLGYTYKYGALDNFEYKDGPYKIELIDDALYVNGLGEDGLTIKRLEPEDFHFQTFTIDVVHNKVLKVNLKLEVADQEKLDNSEKSPVDVYVMTQENPNKWQFDQRVRLKDSSSDTVYSFNLKDEGIYRVKFVYDNANGKVELRSDITGVLKGNSKNIKEVIANIESKKITNFQLFNWDAMMGYNGKGVWENPSDGNNIYTSTATMKEDLINFDASAYEGHSSEEGQVKIADRRPAQNNLTTLTTFSGAAKNGSVEYSDGKIVGKYQIAAISYAGASSQENMKSMIESGVIPDSKEIVFYELLPEGLKIKSAVAKTANTLNKGYFSEGQFNWDHAAGNDSFWLSPLNSETPKVSYKVISNNYDGTNRQMVKISVKYNESPIVQFGSYPLYALGVVLDIEAQMETYEIKSYNLVNNFAAQFLDSKGNPVEIEGNSAYLDDGSVFPDLKNKSNQNVFRDLDKDNNTTERTVVGEQLAVTYEQYVAGTELKKKIKADDFDDDFIDYTQTYAGHDYTYRLTFFSDAGKVKNVVIYDSIEQAYGNNPYWTGILKGVDIEEAKNSGFDNIEIYVNTDKYYSAEEMVNDTSKDYVGLTPNDLTEENGWSKINPDTYSNWSDVKTIAFSFGKDTIFGTESDLPLSVNVYLKMTAPTKIHDEQTSTNQILAYNAPAYYAEKVVGDDLNNFISDTTYANTVTIGLKSGLGEIPSINKSYEGDKLPSDFSEDSEFEIAALSDAPIPRTYVDGVLKDEISSIIININSKKTTNTSSDNIGVMFTEPGEYSYEITEKEGNKDGVSYSKAKYKIVFNVTDERKEVRYDEDTDLKVEMKVYKVTDDNGEEIEEENEVESIDFVNNYEQTESSKEIIDSPKTLDNIIKYVVLSLVAFISLIVFAKVYNNRKKA